MKRLTALVHGDAGAGKSWLFCTAPGPRLYLDAEGRAEHLPTRVVEWDPRQPPPDPAEHSIDTDTTIAVDVRSYSTLKLTLDWLEKGGHYFKSVGVDSITEAQDRVVEDVKGGGAADLQDWGIIYDKLNDYVLALKDLRKHPTCPLDVVYVVAGSEERASKLRPYVRGQIAKKLPYRFDLVGYLTREVDPTAGTRYRSLLLDAAGLPIEAKSNIHSVSQHYGARITEPNLAEILSVINQPQEAPAT